MTFWFCLIKKHNFTSGIRNLYRVRKCYCNIMHTLNYCLSKFNMHSNQLEIVLKCRFWLSRYGDSAFLTSSQVLRKLLVHELYLQLPRSQFRDLYLSCTSESTRKLKRKKKSQYQVHTLDQSNQNLELLKVPSGVQRAAKSQCANHRP